MLKSLLGSCLFLGLVGTSSIVNAEEPDFTYPFPEDEVSQAALDLVAVDGDPLNLTSPLESEFSELSDNVITAQGNSEQANKYNSRPSYGYVSLGLGVGIPNNATADDVLLRLGNQFTTGNVDQSLDVGFSGEVAAGYQYKDARFELAVGYGSLNGSGGTVNTTVQNTAVNFDYDADVSGDYVSILVNGYYDIPTGTKWRPYLGVGLGYVNVSVGDTIFNTDFGQVEVITGNSAGTFGYQGKLGLSYEALPKGNVFGEAAYLGTTSYKNYSGLGVWRFALGWRQGF